MAGPPNWQYNNQASSSSSSSSLYPQSSNYRPNNLNYEQRMSPSQIPLRPLQPNPRPTLGYSTHPYPKDNLTPEQLERGKVEKRRTRISRACDACRRKKIKCDTNGQGNTCKNCELSNIDCTYNDSAKKRGPPKGYIEVLENRLKRMEQMLGSLTSEVDETPPLPKKRKESATATTDPNMTQKPKVVPENTLATTTIAEAPTATAGTRTEKTPALEISSVSAEIRTRYIGDMNPLPFLAHKINFEDARIASAFGMRVKRFGQSLILFEEEDASGRDANHRLLDDLGMLKPGETIKSLNDWIYKVTGIDKTTSDSLLKIFFAYIHPGLPVVNKQLFLKQYRGEIGQYPSAPLLNAIFGSAVRYIETCRLFGDKVPEGQGIEVKDGWSEKLFDNLLVYVKGRYVPSVATVQALVITQNHRASLDEKMASNWLLNSAAIRMAQDLGLHRLSDNWDIPKSEKETRKRVWWCVYIMDKWSSAATGRPQTIFDEDCDETYPSESADWEEVMDTTPIEDPNGPRYPSLDKSVAQKAKSEKIPIYQPFVQLIKLSEILGRLLQGLYTPLAKKHSERHGSNAIVTYLDSALSDWRNALPPGLQISTNNVRRLDSHGRIPLLSMSGIMYMSYCTMLILLHRPFIEKDGEQKTKSSQTSLSICTSAATRCVDIAEKMHYRDFLLVTWNFAIYPVFTASLIHIYNAANPDSIVAEVAKTQLVKAMSVIKRLSKISVAARMLYNVLAQLSKIREVSIDTDPVDQEQIKMLPKAWRENPDRKKKTTSEARYSDENGGSDCANSGCKRTKYLETKAGTQRDSSAELASPSLTIAPDPEAYNSPNSTPTSSVNGDWINGLYSSLQSDTFSQESQQQQQTQQQQQQQQPLLIQQTYQQPQSHMQQYMQQSYVPRQSNASVDMEPYSLRQFGLDMEPTYASTSSHNQEMSGQSTFQANTSNSMNNTNNIQSFALPTNPSDSFLFGLNDLGAVNPLSIQPTLAAYESAPSAAETTTSSAPFSSQTLQTEVPNIMNQTLFRNRPDNAFWAVPTSIELDDWTAYLLPQSSTAANQQTAATSLPLTEASWNPHSQSWV